MPRSTAQFSAMVPLYTYPRASNVPWTGLTAWNPPLLVGAFYCFGDLLVNLSVAKFEGQPMAEVNHDVLG